MIEQYGWSEAWATAFAPHAHAGHTPGRVVLQHRNGYLVATDAGELQAKASGRLRHEAQEVGPPAVGDWVVAPVTRIIGNPFVKHGGLGDARKARASAPWE